MLWRQHLFQWFSVIHEIQFCLAPNQGKHTSSLWNVKVLFWLVFSSPNVVLYCFKVCDIILIYRHLLTLIFSISFFNENGNEKQLNNLIFRWFYNIFIYNIYLAYKFLADFNFCIRLNSEKPLSSGNALDREKNYGRPSDPGQTLSWKCKPTLKPY